MCLVHTGAIEDFKSHNAVLYDASWYPQPSVRCQDSSYSPWGVLSWGAPMKVKHTLGRAEKGATQLTVLSFRGSCVCNSRLLPLEILGCKPSPIVIS